MSDDQEICLRGGVYNDFLIELSAAKRRNRLINVRIRLARRMYLSQSENGAAPYNEIYGRHKRGLHANGFRRSARRAARKRVAVPLVPDAIIIIEFPFDSRLLPCIPNHRKKRAPSHYICVGNRTI